MEGPKIAPHTLNTHWAYCSTVGAQARVRTHDMDGERRESTEALGEEEKAAAVAAREQVGQRTQRT